MMGTDVLGSNSVEMESGVSAPGKAWPARTRTLFWGPPFLSHLLEAWDTARIVQLSNKSSAGNFKENQAAYDPGKEGGAGAQACA